ncbi:RES family NAD+ phosphorylase [Methylobacterium sp. E-016]|uniref:RES family NAD+ phosphorylase n=1 Tax=Methylobacterium sp. E-016 TaxID=2836556 RepID=UPI001FBBAA68|nr:RES family NAD+ phosphorylase [Methylobacterium sp. E-016]MCJ2077882.1 RES family NAD+ phosphorylase [Methylobacterium sp. E-016]
MSTLEPAPKHIWRLSKYDDLSGRGGLRVDGRWHTRPQSIVYCAEHPHTAFLELERHTGGEMFFPDDLLALKIEVPNHAKMQVIAEADLDPLWSDEVSGYRVCQPIGDDWLRSIRTPLLCVPSVVEVGRRNILLNPAHPDATDFRLAEIVHPATGQPFPDYIRKP